MANMSHCMFSNTSRDLQDCLDEMDGSQSLKNMELSREELAAMNKMRDQCHEFIERHEGLINHIPDSRKRR